jgi:hypothetical protein
MVSRHVVVFWDLEAAVLVSPIGVHAVISVVVVVLAEALIRRDDQPPLPSLRMEHNTLDTLADPLV